jgi:RNA polymerase sigma factor (sigma-70 family)
MKTKITEKELIKGCKQNKALAQKQVYDLYASKMLGLCKRYIKNIDEAEDVMINGFLKVFDKIEQFKEEGSFEGWIKRIIVNDCLNQLRKQKMVFVETETAQIAENQSFSYIDSQFDTEYLLQMIDELPTGYKTVFNLYAIEGYSHQEIGNMLGISESTSKSQLSRAKAQLQKTITELNEKNTLKYGK